METPLLAAALIVKNEERFLPDCLASLNALRPLLSEICVYDTGSTDRTIEIAEAAGARVERGYWDDDFARARNASIAMCDAKWVMIVDADERVTVDVAALGPWLRSALTDGMVGADAATVRVLNVEETGDVFSTLPSMRFLRPGRACYAGAVHEEVVAARAGTTLRVGDLDERTAYWRHLGYGMAAPGAKGERNLELARLRYAAVADASADDRAPAQLHVARSLMEVGRTEEALSAYLDVWNLPTDVGARIWAGQDLGDILVRIGANEEAAAIARDLQRDGRARDFADWIMARARLGQGRTLEALELLRGIDEPANVAGFSAGTANVLEARMIAEAEAGDRDTATACAIRLIAGHGRVESRTGVLLALWGDRPHDVLAQLLVEAGTEHLAQIVEAAASQGAAGARLADALRRHLPVTTRSS